MAAFRWEVLDPRNVKSKEELINSTGSISDVRDVALAHVLSTTVPEAGNERFLISSGAFSWQEICELIQWLM
jgi:nucleoside-diphosphate-sugar epimerase